MPPLHEAPTPSGMGKGRVPLLDARGAREDDSSQTATRRSVASRQTDGEHQHRCRHMRSDLHSTADDKPRPWPRPASPANGTNHAANHGVHPSPARAIPGIRPASGREEVGKHHLSSHLLHPYPPRPGRRRSFPRHGPSGGGAVWQGA